MSNILAGIGRGQMEVIDDRLKRMRDTFCFYREKLNNYEGIKFIDKPDELYFSNRWLTTILINTAIFGIQVKICKLSLRKIILNPDRYGSPCVFSSCPAYTNGVSDVLFSKGLCLPSGSNMSDNDRTRVLDSIVKCLI